MALDTLEEMQEWVDESWEKTPKEEVTETDELLFLIEELGELAEDCRELKGMKENKEVEVDLEKEFGDILLSIITFANRYNVDLAEGFEKTKKSVEERYIE